METKYLRSFLVIADNNGFSRADEQLYITRQGLKRQIDTLEHELGVALFTRTPKGLSLTSAGEYFYEYALSAVKAEDKALKDLKSLGRSSQSLVLLSHTNVRTEFENIISVFKSKYPNVNLAIKYILPPASQDKYSIVDEMYQQIRDGIADIALHVKHEGDVTPSDLKYIKMQRQSVNCLVMPGHPLANEEYITYEELSKYHIAFTQHRQDSQFAAELKKHCPDYEICEVSFNYTPDIFSVCYNSGVWVTRGYYANFLPPLIPVPLAADCRSYSGALCKKCSSELVSAFLEVLREVYPDPEKTALHKPAAIRNIK